ncbi:MAG: hypothetical protein PHP26_06410 [Syntrophomonas sp.]|nr:hypothetical protein [Syntrophomonas sp.]
MTRIQMRVRFDFMGKSKSGRLLWGGKNPEQLAEELRQHKASLIRNIPVQGVHIDDIDMSQDLYSIYDEISGKQICFAPVLITFTAASMEDAIRFTMKEEFRTVELIEPEEITLSRPEIERLLLRISEELAEYRNYIEKRLDNWK